MSVIGVEAPCRLRGIALCVWTSLQSGQGSYFLQVEGVLCQ